MKNEANDNLTPIERALRELSAADRAGVFEQTRVDAQTLLRADAAPSPATRRFRSLIWFPTSAAAVLAVAFCGWMFQQELAHVRSGSNSIRSNVLATAVNDDAAIGLCFTGPRSAGKAMKDCSGHDYDGDGDVDLADYHTLQLACARPSR